MTPPLVRIAEMQRMIDLLRKAKAESRRNEQAEKASSTLRSSSSAAVHPLEGDDEAATPAIATIPAEAPTSPAQSDQDEEDQLLSPSSFASSSLAPPPGPSQFPMSPPRHRNWLDEESDVESMAEEVEDDAEVPKILEFIRSGASQRARAQELESEGEDEKEDENEDEDEEQDENEDGNEGDEEGEGEEEDEHGNGDGRAQEGFVKQEAEDDDMYVPEDEVRDPPHFSLTSSNILQPFIGHRDERM
jgi:cobalamin biosynthesis protein CobT